MSENWDDIRDILRKRYDVDYKFTPDVARSVLVDVRGSIEIQVWKNVKYDLHFELLEKVHK